MEQEAAWWLIPLRAQNIYSALAHFVRSTAEALAEMDQLPPEERQPLSVLADIQRLLDGLVECPETSAVVRGCLTTAGEHLAIAYEWYRTTNTS